MISPEDGADHSMSPAIDESHLRRPRDLWCDLNMRMLRVLALCLTLASRSVAHDFKLTLQNPDMELGHDLPAGWSGKFGKVTIIRDTTTFHGGTASLSVQNTGGGSGSGHQMLPVKPGLKLTLGGWIRSSEGAKVNFAAQFFDEKFTWNEFVQVKYLEGAYEWQWAEKKFTVPERATRMAISLYVDGVGRGWLDDVTLSAEGAIVEVQAPDPVPEPPKEPEDAKVIPTTPLPGYYVSYPKAWMVYHENNVKRAKQGDVDVLFLGDSLTQNWGNAGREAWNKNFAPLKAAYFGIGGDKTGNLLWRLDHGELDGLVPKVVVLMIGVNNLWSGKNTAEEIAGGIRAVVEKLRAKLPQAKVLVLGLLPIGAKAEDIGRWTVSEINAHAAKVDDGAMVKFVDLGPKFLQKDGKLLQDAFAKDNLHLSTKGYEILAKELAPVVTEMMK
jgi:lysophospholipase L1-like esterase